MKNNTIPLNTCSGSFLTKRSREVQIVKPGQCTSFISNNLFNQWIRRLSKLQQFSQGYQKLVGWRKDQELLL